VTSSVVINGKIYGVKLWLWCYVQSDTGRRDVTNLTSDIWRNKSEGRVTSEWRCRHVPAYLRHSPS
jgi:hypothetical protein